MSYFKAKIHQITGGNGKGGERKEGRGPTSKARGRKGRREGMKGEGRVSPPNQITELRPCN